jgi:hypothetical protein
MTPYKMGSKRSDRYAKIHCAVSILNKGRTGSTIRAALGAARIASRLN